MFITSCVVVRTSIMHRELVRMYGTYRGVLSVCESARDKRLGQTQLKITKFRNFRHGQISAQLLPSPLSVEDASFSEHFMIPSSKFWTASLKS